MKGFSVMKKRSFLLPVILGILIVAGAAFLIVSLNRDPYESAIKKADEAMEKGDYEKAISQYTIAQNLKPNEALAYTKALEAIAKSNDLTMVKDILTTVNECVNYCGDNSIEPSYIVYITNIMEANGEKEKACDVLSHLYYTLAQSDEVQKKLSELQGGKISSEEQKDAPEQTAGPQKNDENVNEQEQSGTQTTAPQTQAVSEPTAQNTQRPVSTPKSTPARTNAPARKTPETDLTQESEESAKPTDDAQKSEQPLKTEKPQKTSAENTGEKTNDDNKPEEEQTP